MIKILLSHVNQVMMNLTNKNSKKKWSVLKKLVKKIADKVLALKYLESTIKNLILNRKLFKKALKLKNKFLDYYKNQSFSKTLTSKICNASLKQHKHLNHVKVKLSLLKDKKVTPFISLAQANMIAKKLSMEKLLI